MHVSFASLSFFAIHLLLHLYDIVKMEKFDIFYNPSLKDSVRPVRFFAVLKLSIYFDQLICDCGEDSYLEAQRLSYQHYLTLLNSYQAQYCFANT